MSIHNQLPYFPLYASDWLTGQGTTRMTPEQRGGFIDLLCHAWNAKPPCTLPDDESVLAKLSGLGHRWRKVGGLIRAQFVPAGEGLLMNPKQMTVFQEVCSFRENRVESGRLGGLAKSSKRLAQLEKTASKPLANAWQTPSEDTRSTPSKSYPSSSSSYSDQREEVSLNVRDPTETDEAGIKAAGFLDRYPIVYAKVRHGARYLVKPVRDFYYAQQLVAAWPDLDRLELMAEVFLRMSAKEANNIPGTPGQFLHMAPECDARLREYGR